MLTFSEITLADKPKIDGALSRRKNNSCEYCFGNYYIWRKMYNMGIAYSGGDYIIKMENFGGAYGESFLYPGDALDKKAAVDAIISYCADKNQPFLLHCVSQSEIDELEEIYPNKFYFNEDRNSEDYIYSADDLMNLSGKKYHGKRNHIAKFNGEYDWSFEEITKENIGECVKMNSRWCAENICGHSETLKMECCAVKEALKSFFELDLFGGLIRINGEVAAYTAAERINDDTVAVHIEKAFSQYQGLYAAINREFVEKVCVPRGYKLINREEDMGVEGLRKAKLSYYPVELHRKYGVTLK